MSNGSSGSAERCRAETNDGSRCENDATEAGLCGIHNRHGATPVYGGDDGRDDSAGDNSARLSGIPTNREYYNDDDTQTLIAAMYGKAMSEGRDDDDAMTAAKFALRKASDGKSASPGDYEAMFGPCSRCDDGANGWDANLCYTCQQEAGDDATESDDDGGATYCMKCGDELPDEAAYCPGGGTEV